MPYALPVSWTLAIEEFSYLLIGGSILITLPLLRFTQTEKKLRWLSLFPAFLIVCGVLVRLTTVQGGQWQDLSHSPWLRLDALAYGLLLACWLEPKPIATASAHCWKRPWIPALLFAATLIMQEWRMNILVNLTLTSASDAVIFGTFLLPSLGIVTSGWVILSAAWKSSGIAVVDLAIARLAKISYSVYLVHIPIRSLILQHWQAKTTLEGLFLFSGFILSSIVIGDLSYRLLEEPFLRIKRRLCLSEKKLS